MQSVKLNFTLSGRLRFAAAGRMAIKDKLTSQARLHGTTCCQTGCQTGLTTGCIVYRPTNIQPVVKPVWQPVWQNGCIVYTGSCQTGLYNRFDNRVERTAVHSTRLSNRVCQTGSTTRFDNRLNEQRLFVQHGCQIGYQTGLYNRFDNRLDVCLHDTAGCQTCCTTGLTLQPLWQPVVSCKRGLSKHKLSVCPAGNPPILICLWGKKNNVRNIRLKPEPEAFLAAILDWNVRIVGLRKCTWMTSEGQSHYAL